MSVIGLSNGFQGLLDSWSIVKTGKFSVSDFFEGLCLTGFAGKNQYTTGQNADEYIGSNASQELGQQLGSIAYDTAATFLPPPIRRLFAVGNVIEAGKEALSGNLVDAVQNLLTAGMQFAGVQGPKDLGAKIAARNPTLTKAVTELAGDVPRSIRLKSNFKAAPAKLVPGETPMVLQTKRQIAEQIKANTMNINTNAGIVTQQLKTEASNLTANAAQKAGSGWRHVSSNFNAGGNPVANSSKIIIPNQHQPMPNPNAHIIIAHS